VGTNKFSWEDDPGPYPLLGGHFVAVVGVDPAGADPDLWSEPIAVYTNGDEYSWGRVWWDYADLNNRYTYLVSPGGSPGSFVTAPTLTAPEDGEYFTILRPTLSWNSASGASAYKINLGTTPDFSGTSYVYDASNTSYTFQSDLQNTTYFWRVAPINSNGNVCQFGNARSFTINTSIVPSILTDADTISVAEGSTRTFQVRLSSQPPSTITVTVAKSAGDPDISVSAGSSLSFTTSNWSTWKTATLRALDDADATNGTATISLTATGLPTKTVTAVEEDNDVINFYCGGYDSWSCDEGQISECGVKLTAQPTSTVVAYVVKSGGDADITLTKGSPITFTTSDWNTYHTITFSASQDADAYNGTANFRIYATGIPDKYQPVVEQDDDTMAFEIEGGVTSVVVPEGGTSTFRVRLTAQPISDYAVNVFRRYATDDSDIEVQSGYSLIFNSSNYLNYQTVTLAALEDIDCTNGQADIRLKGVGINKIYKSVIATELDNDVLEILTSSSSLGVPEESTASFQVRLSHQPASDTTLNTAWISGDSDITVQEGGALVFTASNWSQDQIVTLAAANDADLANGEATIRISSTELTSVDITATEIDNDVIVLLPEINIKHGSTNIADGGTYDFGSHNTSTNTDITFTIENLGTANLTLSGAPIITIAGANANQFSVQQQPSSPIASSSSTSFMIRFTPTSAGLKTASISIANNDSNENPFDIILQGTGVDPGETFQENWNSGVIDSNKWSFVDNVDPNHGGHKASVVNGELFINAIDDFTCNSGIISKRGFPSNTTLTLKYRIHQVYHLNPAQGILYFLDSGNIDATGYTTGVYLFGLVGGKDENRVLYVDDADGNQYPLGNYSADQNYTLQIIFGQTETRVTTNGQTIVIPHGYSKYHVAFGGHVEDSYFDDLNISPGIKKHDLVGTWDGQGVYYRNSDTRGWVPMASPATIIAVGDLDCDGIDDLIGVWPSQGGVWVKLSSTGEWVKIGSTPRDIAAGDMDGDGCDELVGTWDGQGVFYKESLYGNWVKLASPATIIAVGNIDCDSIDDLIGIWPTQSGVWAKLSKTSSWQRLSSTAKHIATGDMDGDGCDELLGTWDGQGVCCLESLSGAWVKMASPADLLTAGDLDGDAKDDLIGIWPMQGGVWVKYSATKTWERLSSTARDIAAGKMRAGTGGSTASQALFGPMGGYAQGPESLIQYQDISSEGPGGLHFVYQTEEQLIPQEHESEMMRIPGPGEPGFRCVEEKNPIPEESRDSSANRNDIDRSKK
jgi:hypothetical protein